jgi:hypothetical protein
MLLLPQADAPRAHLEWSNGTEVLVAVRESESSSL